MASESITVTRKYLPDPSEIFSVQLLGKTKEKIAQQIIESTSSPRLGSYTLDINEQQDEAIIWHIRPSHEHLKDARMVIEQMQNCLAYLEEKEKEREEKEEKTLKWEVSSKIAQAINDESISNWRKKSDSAGLVQRLEERNLHFLPLTMAAEAVRWRSKFPRDDSVIKIELFYTNEEQEKYLAAAKRNEDCQADIDMAWRLLEENKVDLNLMLTTWAKRHRDRNCLVHMVPSVAFAEIYVNGDEDFCGTAELGVRARYHIHNGKCSA